MNKLNRYSILVVDDDNGVRKLLHEALSYDGYTVVTAASGQEALTRLQHELPNLILLDIKMPGINGIDLIQKITEINNNISIIIISGYTDQPGIEEVIIQSCVKYILAKPFDLEELRGVVANLVF